ncbi:MAG: response regulator [Thermodesulfobacteriota bacterium]
MVKVLVVDDDSRYRAIIERVLSRTCQFAVTSAATERQAWETLEHDDFDLVLLDLYIEGQKSWETLKRVATHPGKPVAILFSCEDTRGNADLAASLGAYAFLPKPFDFMHLQRNIESALGLRIRDIFPPAAGSLPSDAGRHDPRNP